MYIQAQVSFRMNSRCWLALALCVSRFLLCLFPLAAVLNAKWPVVHTNASLHLNSEKVSQAVGFTYKSVGAEVYISIKYTHQPLCRSWINKVLPYIHGFPPSTRPFFIFYFKFLFCFQCVSLTVLTPPATVIPPFLVFFCFAAT